MHDEQTVECLCTCMEISIHHLRHWMTTIRPRIHFRRKIYSNFAQKLRDKGTFPNFYLCLVYQFQRSHIEHKMQSPLHCFLSFINNQFPKKLSMQLYNPPKKKKFKVSRNIDHRKLLHRIIIHQILLHN